MITTLRFILCFLLALVFAILAQAVGSAPDDFRIVDTNFRTESIILKDVDSEIFSYDSSGALLHQRKSIDGEDDLSRYEELGAIEPLFSFLLELVATNKVPIWSPEKLVMQCMPWAF